MPSQLYAYSTYVDLWPAISLTPSNQYVQALAISIMGGLTMKGLQTQLMLACCLHRGQPT